MVREQPAPPFTSRVYVPILVDSDNFDGAIDDAISKIDDRYWAYYAVQRFTWQRFVDWWTARRWVQPRDVRKR